MPVYNVAPYLDESIQSILHQTFDDFEFVIIDDGSTDEGWAILNSYSDSRIRLLRSETNQGWIKSLSKILHLARGRYIARQDADDISVPDRLDQQITYLERNPNVVLVGTAYMVINKNGNFLETIQPPAGDTDIRWHMLFHNSFAHSSVMFRSETFMSHQLNYDTTLRHAEDYKLWSEFLRYGKGANLERPLLKYRVHPAQVVQLFSEEKEASANEISQSNLAQIGVQLNISEVTELRQHYYSMPFDRTPKSIRTAATFLDVLNAFRRQPGLNSQLVRDLQRKYTQRAIAAIPLRRLPPQGAYQLFLKAIRCDPVTTLMQIGRRTGTRTARILGHRGP